MNAGALFCFSVTIYINSRKGWKGRKCIHYMCIYYACAYTVPAFSTCTGKTSGGDKQVSCPKPRERGDPEFCHHYTGCIGWRGPFQMILSHVRPKLSAAMPMYSHTSCDSVVDSEGISLIGVIGCPHNHQGFIADSRSAVSS